MPGDLTEHFSRNEFASRWEQRGGTVIVTPVPDELLPNVKRLAQNLEVVRAEWGKPLIPGSAYRPPDHNADVGGVENSQHVFAKAADFIIPGVSKDDIYCTIRRLMASGKMDDGGLGWYGPNGHIHYDWDPKRAPWKGKSVTAFPTCPEEDDDMALAEDLAQLRRDHNTLLKFVAESVTQLRNGQAIQNTFIKALLDKADDDPSDPVDQLADLQRQIDENDARLDAIAEAAKG